jgi:hypothetical protein
VPSWNGSKAVCPLLEAYAAYACADDLKTWYADVVSMFHHPCARGLCPVMRPWDLMGGYVCAQDLRLVP